MDKFPNEWHIPLMKHAFLKILVFCLILLVSPYYLNAKAQEGVWMPVNKFSNFPSSIETTPWGIAAGEFDTRAWLNPFNGVRISKDFGKTWDKAGLENRGVTDIAMDSGTIYASTYYWEKNMVGLFMSKDGGKSWTHTGENFTALSVSASKENIYLGTASHGLWVSNDGGSTWKQALGYEFFLTGIILIKSSEDVAIAVASTKTYTSTDKGLTWKEARFFANKGILSVFILGKNIYAGTKDNKGLYFSADSGATWKKLESFGDYTVEALTVFDNILYAGRKMEDIWLSTIYTSEDSGVTWNNTNLNIESPSGGVKDIAGAFSKPNHLFALLVDNGIYKYEIPAAPKAETGFFNIPWKSKSDTELVDKITSFFDHSYPLLGYGLHSEPFEESITTLNYLGIKNKEPYIYYSSHDGYDYDLKYGAEVRAAASGNAVYYSCGACGNAIKIDHQNGYQTVYMHLKKDGLLTKSDTQSVLVNKGDVLGYVGMTGNTTGPHLHFGVLKDANANIIFNDDYPQGKVDPYGWFSDKVKDPWPLYSWNDALGPHTGTKSDYLWSIGDTEKSLYNGDVQNELIHENKKITFPNEIKNLLLTTFIRNYAKPALPESQKALGYAELTSVLISAYNLLGERITLLESPVKLEIDLNNLDLSGLVSTSLKIYFWSEETGLWEVLNTSFDSINKKLSAETNHFSHFAVFGEKPDSAPPQTLIDISGENKDGWYIEFPKITLTTVDQNLENIIFYTYEGENKWQEYSQPFTINQSDTVNLLFRALDPVGNLEETQSYFIKINADGKWHRTIRILNANFGIF